MTSEIKIIEVGLRDGLQNSSKILKVETRFELVKKLLEAGLTRIELGAFVNYSKVPAMSGTPELVDLAYKYINSELINNTKVPSNDLINFSALVPNEKGMQAALLTPLREVALFAATSDTFSQKNINCSIDESFQRFTSVIQLAKKEDIKVRGYLSTCFGCPYEGDVPESQTLKLVQRFLDLGVYEISIGDTIGIASPKQAISLFSKLINRFNPDLFAGHFHNTRGLAIANIFACHQLGINKFDSSIGGIGGCPFAPGSAGNVSTEEVVYLFQKMGLLTNINLDILHECSNLIKLA